MWDYVNHRRIIIVLFFFIYDLNLLFIKSFLEVKYRPFSLVGFPRPNENILALLVIFGDGLGVETATLSATGGAEGGICGPDGGGDASYRGGVVSALALGLDWFDLVGQ